MSEDDVEDEMTTGRRRGLRHGSSSAALVRPLENDDLLARILLRLPALPSSLLRASAVCKRWHGLGSCDPRFLREFRAHHRSAPLLGFFPCYLTNARLEFHSMLNPPDQIPSSRFTVTVPASMGRKVLRCHHGRVLILNQLQKHFLVWDPVTAELRQIAFPAAFGSISSKIEVVDGAVVCASDEQGHVHGACHSDPFKLVLVADDRQKYYACVYSSETGAWGNLFSMIRPPRIIMPSATTPSTMFKNSICLLLVGQMFAILEFDWVRQNLALIDIRLARAEAFASIHGQCQFLIAPADSSSGALSFIVLKVSTVRVWKRVSNGDGTSTWMLGTTIELGKLLSLEPTVSMVPLMLLGLDEEGNVMMKSTESEIVFLVNLESLKFKQLPQKLPYIFCHPFSSFYTPGMYLGAGGNDEDQTFHGV